MDNFTLLDGDYITLGQLLKELGLISTGGQARHYLASHPVLLNHKPEDRRGKKLYPEDLLKIGDLSISITSPTQEERDTYQADKLEEDRLKTLVKKLNQEDKTKSPKSPPLDPFRK